MGSSLKSFIWRWVTTTNHKDIGILYIVTALYFLFVAGSLAMLMRIQLFSPGAEFLDASKYNQAITVHGLVAVLWAISPLAFGFANYIVPLQIGARDLAFPRLNALSYWLYLFSGLMAVITFFLPGGAPDVGWTIYSPLSTAKYSPQPGLTVGGVAVLVLAASVTLSTINFIVTIIKMRAPGLTWYRVPMFTWSILFTVIMMLFAFPTLAAAVLLLGFDRIFNVPIFSSPNGGAILWGHMFWFFGHPEVYIVLTPALGLVLDIVPTFARRPLFGKKYIIWSIYAAIIISFIVYVHHMFTTGINPIVREIYSITTETISIPFGIIVLAIIATLYRSRIKYTVPMLFALASVFHFIIGGSTGVYLSSVTLDHHLRGTYWVVAHLHYQLVAATTFGLIAGLYYYYPKITGKMYDEKLGRIHFILSVISINLLYFPMFFLYDMPRRIHVYDVGEWALPNHLASIGGWIFGFSQLLLLYNLIKSYGNGSRAGNNPWNAWTLEWSTTSPPPPHNFDAIPDLRGGTLSYVNGGVSTHHHFPGTPLPFLLSFSVFLTLLGALLFSPFMITGLIILIISLAYWYRDDIKDRFAFPEEEWESRPFQGIYKEKLGMWVLIASETILFASILGAYLFIRFRTPGWPPSYLIHDVSIGFINTIILLTSSLFIALALAYIKDGSLTGLKLSLLATFILGSLFLVIKWYEWSKLMDEGFILGQNIVASIYYITTGLHAAHVTVGLLGILYLIIKAFKARYGPENHSGVEVMGLYWHFVDIIWLFLFPLFYLI